MDARISPRDLEQLSAYLDGQLIPEERVRLESRLRASHDLRASLKDLQHTRVLLRAAPQLKAPRSFKLTPQMIGSPSVKRIYPVFQFASVLAGVMLVLVLVGDLLTGSSLRTNAPLPAAKVAQEMMVTEQAVEVASTPTLPSAPQETETPRLSANAANPLMGEAGTPTEGLMVSKAGVNITETITSTGVTNSTVPGGLAFSAGTVVPPSVLADTTIESTEVASFTGATSELLSATPSIGGERQLKAGLNLLQILEIILAVLAIGLGVIAIVLRRREHLRF